MPRCGSRRRSAGRRRILLGLLLLAVGCESEAEIVAKLDLGAAGGLFPAELAGLRLGMSLAELRAARPGGLILGPRREVRIPARSPSAATAPPAPAPIDVHVGLEEPPPGSAFERFSYEL